MRRPEGGGASACFLTRLSRSRAEFLSLLKNYNYFLKEQTQLQLSYARVRPRCCYLNVRFPLRAALPTFPR